MAVRGSSSWARRVALVLAAGVLAGLGGCVVAPVDPYYEVGAPVVVQPGPAYSYYGSPYYATPYPYWQRPYYAAPPVSIGIWGRIGGGHRHSHGHRHRPGRRGGRR